MVNFKTRPLLIGVLFGVLSLYALNLLSEKNALLRQNHNLIEDSRNLGRTLELIQQQNREIIRSVQGADKEKETLQQALERLQKENESIQLSIKKNAASYESLKEEKSYLEEMLINKTKQIEILNSRQREEPPPVSMPSYEDLPAEGVGQAIQQKDAELRQLNEQNRVLQEKLDRLYKTTSDKINEINIAKIALADTVSTARKKIEDEWNTVNLGSVTTSAVSDRDKLPPSEAKQQPKSEGHVLAINNEHGFVVIDLGKVDNLSSESTLEVKKNGVAIATLNILEIRDVMAACNIRELVDGQRVEINDPVSILR